MQNGKGWPDVIIHCLATCRKSESILGKFEENCKEGACQLQNGDLLKLVRLAYTLPLHSK